MFKCIFCGLENLSINARFCTECGPENPSVYWKPQDIDEQEKVTQYETLIRDFIFDTNQNMEFNKIANRIRERLKISHSTHLQLIKKLQDEKKSIEHLFHFQFEFNENLLEAYAGHDTFLSFRYTNLSEMDLFNVAIYWDDLETTDRVDLQAQTRSFVKPKTSVSLGSKVVFDRMGLKEISNLRITVTDQFGDGAIFIIDPFKFKIANHEKNIINNISTHNQISIEGRGVVDATVVGIDKNDNNQPFSDQPRWKQLGFKYLQIANHKSEDSSLIINNIYTYNPTTKSKKRFYQTSELIEHTNALKSTKKYWRVLVESKNNSYKSLIRKSIIGDTFFNLNRTVTAEDLQAPKNLGAIVTTLDENSLLELDGLDLLFQFNKNTAELLYSIVGDFQLDIMVGEGENARGIKLDLIKFCSIYYCKDIEEIPNDLIREFDCCIVCK
jgi:hypothetical protein